MNTALPLIIAHRGASVLAPENTLAAFNLAYLQKADGIELDVMLSKDGRLVVMHDDTVDRTTNGSGRVRDLTIQELRKLDAGSHFSDRFSNEKIPLLAEVLEQLGGKLMINIELKNYATPFDQLTKLVINLVQQFKLEDSVIFSSFNPINISRAKKQSPSIIQGLLTFPGMEGSLMNGILGRLFPYDALHPYFANVDEKMILKMHKLGRKVNVWTVDDPDELRRLHTLGVDAIICNDPKEAREVLEGV